MSLYFSVGRALFTEFFFKEYFNFSSIFKLSPQKISNAGLE